MFRGCANVIAICILTLTGILVAATLAFDASPLVVIPIGLVGTILGLSPRIINDWDRAVLLRLGEFKSVLSPGISWVVPGIDMISSRVDMRIRSTPFSAEKTLTQDTVPVNVDAVLFWVVVDAKRAILEVQEYEKTISWAAQTTLRDVIGKSELVRMISDRQGLDEELLGIIDAKTSDWGITVQSVELRDVRIPPSLEDAMSRKAQADREKEARVILAESEIKVAEQMELASRVYARNHAAMQLRAMNMTYESIKERGALMVIPSGMAESIDTGVIGMAAAGFKNDAASASDSSHDGAE